MRKPRAFVLAALLASTILPVAGAGAQPSNILNTYVLFAQDSIRVRTASISGGNVGVNDGLLYTRGTIAAGESDFAAALAHMDSPTDCRNLFTNALVGTASSCPHAVPSVPRPILSSIPQASGFPAPFPDCDPSKPILVDHDQVLNLPLGPNGTPGVYGNLVVEGGGEGPAVLELAAGEYRFCNVRVGRNGSILFSGPATVHVAGNALMSNATDIGPDVSIGANAPAPGAIKWYVRGSLVRYSRKGNIGGYVCAPNAKMLIGSGVILKGRYVARSIRMKKSIITYTPPVPGVCGDTVISPGEQCETNADCGGGTCLACQCQSSTTTSSSTTTTTTVPPECNDDPDCNNGSTSGAFVCEDGHCVPACDDDADCNDGSAGGAFVCIDGHCVPGGSSTTTTTTVPGPSSTTTTTTTLRPCTTDDDCPVGRCTEGVCTPECETDDDCNAGSPGGSFVCVNGRCEPGGEICEDCIDNNGDGLVDFEDPACCNPTAGARFEMQLKKGRFRPRAQQQSLLKLKGALARSGLASMIDPPGQHVEVQIRSQESGEVLCARFPAGSFRKVKKGFRYLRKKSPLPVDLGRNLDGVRIKISKSGQVSYRVKGKKAQLTTPAEGTLQITVGFAGSGEGASQNVCSQGVRLFRGVKKGALRFP